MSAKHERWFFAAHGNSDKRVAAACYTSLMTVQTIPEIDEMTAVQQVELMEALWKNMSERNLNSKPPDWHHKYLADREDALANGEDSFITLDEFEANLRKDLK